MIFFMRSKSHFTLKKAGTTKSAAFFKLKKITKNPKQKTHFLILHFAYLYQKNRHTT
jgi:hypothetical protein